jgi:transcription elongation factor Elf1
MSTLDPVALRKARKARIAARKEAHARITKAQKATSAYNYNPIYQKKTHLGDDQGNGYHYFGPPPDAGTSYGVFATSEGGMISPMVVGDDALPPRDPATGEQAILEGPADKDALAAMYAAKFKDLPGCKACGTKLVTSADIYGKPVNSLFCTVCGQELTEDVEVLKQQITSEDETEEIEEEGEEEEKNENEEENLEEEEDVNAVQYEALSDINDLNDLVQEDIHMSLFDKESKNPYWNIDVKGTPVARVYLSDQPKPDETIAVFITDQYRDGVTQAIPRVGLDPVLKQINAKLWANKIEKSKVVQDIHNRIKASVVADHNKITKEWKNTMLNRIALVCAGMDKNFWKDEGNPLKEAIYASFRSYGIPSDMVTVAIEKAFKTGSTPYFNTILNKAAEFMSMSKETIAELEKVIGNANVLNPEVLPEAGETDIPTADGVGINPTVDPTLASRLGNSSVAISNVLGAPQANGSVQSLKAAWKQKLRLKGVGPNK